MTMSQDLLSEVLDLEWEMFSEVRSAGSAACQSAPGNFRSIRGSLFSLWTDEMLASYRHDLVAARTAGRNLLMEKYARMDGLLPPPPANPMIEIILDIELDWQRDLRERYPALYARCCRQTDLAEDGSDFAIYLRGELETYGYDTVELYYANVDGAARAGRNLAVEALQQLVLAAGYADVDQAEKHLSGQRSVPEEAR